MTALRRLASLFSEHAVRGGKGAYTQGKRLRDQQPDILWFPEGWRRPSCPALALDCEWISLV